MKSARFLLLVVALALALTAGSGLAVEGDTGRVSVPNLADQGALGAEANCCGSGQPSISGDGRFVAFASTASNLVVGDTLFCDPVASCIDIFVHDSQTGATEWVSVPNLADQPTLGTKPNGPGGHSPAISANGRFAAFASTTDNLVLGDTSGLQDIFVHDGQTGATERVSVPNLADQPTLGAECTDQGSSRTAISGDGRFVAFQSGCSNLVIADTNGLSDIYVHDRLTGATERVSVPNLADQPTLGAECTDQGSGLPAISDDGRFVASQSGCNNLIMADTNGLDDIYVHDRQTGATERVSVPNLADQPTLGGECNAEGSGLPDISGDGRFIAFQSGCNNLIPSDTNGLDDIYVHDRETGATERVSVPNLHDQATLGAECTDQGSARPAISGDGRVAVFQSGCDNLILTDTNGLSDIYIHDRETGSTARVSVPNLADQGSLGTECTAEGSGLPEISGDGRFTAFQSGCSNLIVSDTNGADDVYVHDNGPLDTDGDGIPDAVDACPLEAPAGGLDADENGCTDTIAGLKSIVEGLDLQPNIEGGLLAKLNDAEKALAKGKTKVAETKLQDFINQVEAQRAKALNNELADLLANYANNVILLI